MQFRTCAYVVIPHISVVTETLVGADDVETVAMVPTHLVSETLVNVHTPSGKVLCVARPAAASKCRSIDI